MQHLIRLDQSHLTAKKKEDAKKNKKLCANEERILSCAEKLIIEEFSFALNLKPDQVIPYILGKVNEQA